MTSKSAFVSGASGFIGVNLVKQLVSLNWDVTAMHRESSNLQYLSKIPVRRVVGDITQLESLLKIMPENTDAVFHVAGNVSFDSSGDITQNRDNIDGTKNMVTCSIEKNISRFIHTSSGASWGLQDNMTITEESPSNVHDIPINYFRTKKLAEDEALAGLKRGLDVVVINPANVVGPFDNVIWGPFVESIFKGDLRTVGTGGAAFCHVEEVAKAHISAFYKGKRGNKYLLAGTQASFQEVGETVANILGAVPPIASSEGDPSMTPEMSKLMSLTQMIDCSKAIEALGFKSVSLQKMFSDLCAWMNEEELLN